MNEVIDIIRKKYSGYIGYSEKIYDDKYRNSLIISFIDIYGSKEKIIQSKLTGEELFSSIVSFEIPLKSKPIVLLSIITKYGETLPVIGEFKFSGHKSDVNYLFKKMEIIKYYFLNFNVKTKDVLKYFKEYCNMYKRTSQKYRDIIDNHIFEFESLNTNNFNDFINIKCDSLHIIYNFRHNVFNLLIDKLDFRKTKFLTLKL